MATINSYLYKGDTLNEHEYKLFQMPRKYIRKTNKASWTSEQLNKAVQAIHNGRSVRNVSNTFSIPRSTLQLRLKNKDMSDPRLGRNPVFTKECEEELAYHVKKLAKLFYGITPKEIKACAHTFAVKNNLEHSFSKFCAGREWLRGFLKRNPTISLRKPEATSLNRITAFNKAEVKLFYSNLAAMLDKHSFPVTRIFNADETGFTSVQVPCKILAEKGQKRVGFATSAERGKNITIMCAFSASGVYVPPLFIFPRKRMADHLKKNGPPGAKYFCSESGWMTEEIFIQWLEHFKGFVKCTKEDPVLLILDNHVTHCTLEAYNFCRENGIIFITIPPHTSHRLQPLDVSFYGPLSSAYNTECDKFLKGRPGERITNNDIAEIFNYAFGRTATPEKAVNGFRATGIVPFNPDVFGEEDFAPSEALNKEIEFATIEVPTTSTEIDLGSSLPIRNQDVDEKTPPKQIQNTTALLDKSVTFSEIIPLLEFSKQNSKKTSRKQHSEIFTSTPMKQLLEEKDRRKKEKISKAQTKGCKRDLNAPNTKPTKQSRETKKRNAKEKPKYLEETEYDQVGAASYSDENDAEVNEDICIICGEFGKNEFWLRCQICGQWAHEACSDGTRKTFICDFCV